MRGKTRLSPSLIIIGALIAGAYLHASEHHGQVRFGELPTPGAVVQATQGEKSFRTVTNTTGGYSLPQLSDGAWNIQIEAPGFETIRREITVSADAPGAEWELRMLPIEKIQGITPTGFPKSTATATATLQTSTPEPETAQRLLINGSVSNGASTPFALNPAFGNNRRGLRSLYTTNISFVGGDSVFDARSFSLTGQETPQPAYSRLLSSITFGGPLQIPHVFRNGQFSVSYNRTQNRNATLQTAQVPTAAERTGDLSARLTPIVDPTSGTQFAGNVIPDARISSQARALVNLYPLPNFTGGGRYNYQVATLGVTHGDNFQAIVNNIAINNSNRLSGTLNLQNTRSDNPDLFGFTDAAKSSTAAATMTWTHRFTQRVSATVRYQFNRTVSEALPYFGNRLNVSGIAGVSGNDPDPRNWGPPSLSFAGGIARLSSGSYAFDRTQSNGFSYSSTWIHGRHTLAYGADYKRHQFNLRSQKDARGTFTFTGAATGSDFADFLLGIPTTSSIAFGNADKYFRQTFADGFATDDWHIKAALTLTLGVRWEYESPITEKYGRLVNLDIAPGFGSATPVVAGTSANSLVNPDKSGFQPRLGLAWRPSAAKSMIVRVAYGIYRDTNVYRAIADQMAQQSPLSKSLNVANTPANPLTLADGFRGTPSITSTTFAIDPHFQPGNAQNWQLSIQQDLPESMQMTLTYLGIKGTHVPQRTLPNTFPSGSTNACTGCPAGFVYLASNGNSSRNSGTIEVRRRQRNGFEASARYTFAKAIDDAGLGGNWIAQNWLDLRAERGLSNFDQRHQLVVQTQYTSGMLTRLGGFWDGWRGKALKQWSLVTQMTLGSGMPLTPVIIAPVNGTGITGSIRPNVTGAPLYTNVAGAYLNPAAFAAPAPGAWGNAGRNSITGPGQFLLNASVTRTFRVNERLSMDLRVDATNVLNHVTFPNWNTTVNSAQFGVPTRANQMRSLQPSLRLRF